MDLLEQHVTKQSTRKRLLLGKVFLHFFEEKTSL